jgi:hypothetical protein
MVKSIFKSLLIIKPSEAPLKRNFRLAPASINRDLHFDNPQCIPSKANTILYFHTYHICHHLMPETVNICS